MPATVLEAIQIPTATRILDNGLTVVVHEDRTSPIVAVHLMYHVGSKDERPGRTGMAHLLEHLLFEGTVNAPKGEFDRLLEGVGGSNNGSTWLDRTNYYETVPSHAVKLALWLERERMAYFVPMLDAEMLEVQRGVVINERKQSYENRPYGLADERLSQLVFPPEHPYSWPTIGYTPDLEAISLQDAQTFFEKYYTPSNSVLVLAGDVSSEEGWAMAEEFFGDIPAGPALTRTEAQVVPNTGERTEVMTDRVSFPRFHRAYPVAAYGTDDWTALDVLSYVLADGESSRLQRQIVRETQLAQDIDTFLYPTELSGVFGIVATARAGVSVDRLKEAVDEVISQVAQNGVSVDEVESAIRRARRDHLAGLATVEDRADEIAYATTVLGSADALQRTLNAYAHVTSDDVQNAAQRWLAPDNGATLNVVPEVKEAK
ncbi:MAG TPA: pitrilysin family protein [Longimicrobiaceae bacterium]|nr:pitrilysin family protein [Longimicrobiaceae bacterium]